MTSLHFTCHSSSNLNKILSFHSFLTIDPTFLYSEERIKMCGFPSLFKLAFFPYSHCSGVMPGYNLCKDHVNTEKYAVWQSRRLKHSNIWQPGCLGSKVYNSAVKNLTAWCLGLEGKLRTIFTQNHVFAIIAMIYSLALVSAWKLEYNKIVDHSFS